MKGYLVNLEVARTGTEKVFADPGRTRRSTVRRFGVGLLYFTVVWAFLFLGDLLSWAVVSEFIPGQAHEDEGASVTDHTHSATADVTTLVPASFRTSVDGCREAEQPLMAALAGDDQAQRVFAFLPSDLAWTHLSLEEECAAVDVVMPEWIFLRNARPGVEVETLAPDARPAIDAFLAKARPVPELFPVVQFEGGRGAEAMLAKLADDTSAQSVLDDLVMTLNEGEADGVCLDFGQLSSGGLEPLIPFVKAAIPRFERAGLQSCVVMRMDQSLWEKPFVADAFDYVVLKAFREPWIGSPPAPLASDEWFAANVERAASYVPAEKLVVALGNFAVDWVSGQPRPELLPYPKALAQIAEARGDVNFSRVEGNSYSIFRDSAGRRHEMWMLDAASAHNQVRQLSEAGLNNIGVWSLGLEDPGVWTVLEQRSFGILDLEDALSRIELKSFVDYRGDGPFLKVVSQESPGLRQIALDPLSGRITNQEFLALPRPFTVERYGKPLPHRLFLTFDDGPHPVYTEKILDILQETDTPATFFLVGSKILNRTDVVGRMVEEGHEIGSHTFSHPRMEEASEARVEFELNSFQKIMRSYASRETVLYREPYSRSGGPLSSMRVASLKPVLDAGYFVTGSDIAPRDWGGMKAGEIISYVVEHVVAGAGNVILLHDAGGDRSEVIKALPDLIRELRAIGYEFGTVSEMLDVPRDTVMPPVSGAWVTFDRMSFGAFSLAWNGVTLAFWTVLTIGLLRSAGVLLLALMRRRHVPPNPRYTPRVSVVIPAFNEESVITRCVESVLDSDYPDFEVVIVDDGSYDETFEKLLRFERDPRVRIITQINQGKWSALNTAIGTLDTEVAVCIDADTQIEPDALRRLAAHFSDPGVGAVAGKVVLGNRVNLLTRLQALEYITAQSIERRAADFVNGIIVVPGALGAWRVAAMKEAGLYSHETLTEDASLTVGVIRQGYRVVYDERACAHTEAPATIRQLSAQRLRWSLGIFQTGWLHKRALLEGRRVGLITLPDMAVFGYIFPLLAPVADIFFLTMLYNYFAGEGSELPGTVTAVPPGYVIAAFLILPAIDFLLAAIALLWDPRERFSMLWLFPFQRFFYRQLLYFAVYRALLRALTGSLAGWNKSRRIGHIYIELKGAR